MRRWKVGREAMALIVMCLLGVAFKAFLLWQRSGYIDPDEGYYLLLARNLASGHGYGFNGLPNIIFPPFLPLLIALVTFASRNPQVSLGIVSALSGGLLGLVVYRICRSEFSSGYSLLGAFLALFVYPLNAFVPINKPYIYVLYRGSDTLNTLLLLAALWAVLSWTQTRKSAFALAAGALAGLAYLTRPEGLIFAVILAGLAAIMIMARTIRVPWKHLSAYLAVFGCLGAPYVLYLHRVTGEWMISGKIEAGQKYRTALVQVIKSGDWEPFNDIHYALDGTRMEMRDRYFGYYPRDRGAETSAPGALKNVAGNLALAAIVPKVLFASPLLLFFGIGLIGGVGRIVRKRSVLDILLLSVFLYSLALLALAYPIPRHHLFVVPVYGIYSLFGIRTLGRVLSAKMSRSMAYLLIGSVVFLSFASDYIRYYGENVASSKNFQVAVGIDQAISRDLRDRGIRVVMSIQPGFAIRAATDWQVLPRTDIPTLLRFARKKKVNAIVIQARGGYRYWIIDMDASMIPDPPSDDLGFQLMESKDQFAWYRIVPQSGTGPE